MKVRLPLTRAPRGLSLWGEVDRRSGEGETLVIRRLLIANRGEIAVRIARTCRQLGVETVAVYSDADRHALHVEVADRAIRLGPPAPARSYLDVAALLAAAKRARADAVHPGYGFLSENAAFADACTSAGLVFVGPRAEAIRAMGSKESSRRLAVELEVPIVPGYHGPAQDEATLAHEAERVGFPLLVKASAGGGGKGIRVVRDSSELAAALATAKREAASAFGDDTLILERYVERARHVEVQVLGDRHGGCVHLLDRECSIQRHHQKLVEEAPAPRLEERIRSGLHESALRIAGAIDYDSTGTVEFLVDDERGEFYFLEMNTRLQVEHPTTELVTGLDLVELQLRIASGERLPSELSRIRAAGSAIEARICAERPEEGFLPATGTVLRFATPEIEGVRVDGGIRAGTVVGAHYDSMLAKIVAHGRDREEARRRLSAALRGVELAGVENNVDYLRSVIETPAFRSARVTTRFLELDFAAEAAAASDEEAAIDRLAAAVAWTLSIEQSRGDRPEPWARLGPWRVTERSGRTSWTRILLRDGSSDYEIRVAGSAGRYRIDGEGGDQRVEAWTAADDALRLEIDGAVHRRRVTCDDATLWVSGGEHHRRLVVISRDEQAMRGEAAGAADPRNLLAPFPGLITSVEVAAGAAIEGGQLLVVMEAMKMVHSLRASGSAVVRGVHCKIGQTVAASALLVEMEEPS